MVGAHSDWSTGIFPSCCTGDKQYSGGSWGNAED